MERLTIAALVPFKHYIRIRRTGKSRIVYYDGNKLILRSSLLPRPNDEIDIRYSRVGLRKLLKKLNLNLRELRRQALMNLPKDRSYALYRLLLRLERIRSKGLSALIKRLKAEVMKDIYHPSIGLRKAIKRLVKIKIKEALKENREFSEVIVDLKRPSGLVGRLKRKLYALRGYRKIGDFYVKVILV